MAVSTCAPMAYAPVIRGIIWLQTRRTAALKIAKCLNPHTAHQVRKQGRSILSLKTMCFFSHSVYVSENALLRKSTLSSPTSNCADTRENIHVHSLFRPSEEVKKIESAKVITPKAL